MTKGVRFARPLSKKALHIDYLRVRCGREAPFNEWMQKRSDIGAYIAFSEWDVVMFTPTAELYPENLTKFYSSGDLTSAIAGSAGYFSYVWDHPVNGGWEGRLTDRVGLTSPSHMSMLVSLRFTDQFRSKLGIGAELLFCDFVDRLLDDDSIRGAGRKRSITAVIAHGLGWNDTTIVLKADKDHEASLLNALTRIRYCTESQCLNTVPVKNDPYIVAATYSHVLGDLDLYVAEQLSFGTLADQVQRARLLVRVNPTLEKSFRKTLENTFAEHRIEGAVGSELGHYNFSADLTAAFRLTGPDPVQIIQGFRRKIEEFMKLHGLASTSFSETTTEITLREDLSPAPVTPPLAEKSLLGSFLKTVQTLLETPDRIEQHASKMTRHRLAILLGTIATYLEDPVRGSVAGHICRFLKMEFPHVLENADRAGQEDLCHILEYALHQATDGLSQFQHDANSLGLSGRGGYSRLIQAVEEYLNELLGSFDLDLMPLLTFGLRPAHEGMTRDYWIDIPFSTAFVPSRWYIVYHEVAHMCWAHIFGWRLDTFEVWNEFASGVLEVNRTLNDETRDPLASPPPPRVVDRKEFLLARAAVDEVFPNYLMLNVVTTGDLDWLNELMIARDLITTPRPVLVRALFSRMILHAVLDLHQQRRPRLDADPAAIRRFREAVERAPYHRECIEIANGWWKTWAEINAAFGATGNAHDEIEKALTASIEDAAVSLRRIILKLQNKASFQRRDALFGAENLASLIADNVFKEDAAAGARQVVRLLAMRGEDYARRAPHAFPQGDPSASQFGFVLAKIESMCDTATRTAETWMPGYANVVEEGWVLANGPGETALSRFLADQAMGSSKDPLKTPALISSLSAILSLWHVAVTSLADAEDVGLEDLESFLRDFGVVSDFSF